MIELTKDYIENLKSIIEAKDDAKAQEVLHELYPADIAELYQELNLQEAIYLYLLMDGDKAADVLMELLRQLRRDYPEARILGHYQLSPYIKKACPCFDARKEYETL